MISGGYKCVSRQVFWKQTEFKDLKKNREQALHGSDSFPQAETSISLQKRRFTSTGQCLLADFYCFTLHIDTFERFHVVQTNSVAVTFKIVEIEPRNIK
ncbi:hypothetical protein F2P81_024274 [Scophthalmus maximus]|uniref:Uncharacterized protein n=1 Tax=Scophthalmus maximus TaxID=52904 RepID=A0A6A4RYZ9_SCOMX|nr:hypothetical protein F2P81_024274 [Scophthalmus maximus]